MLTLYRVAQKLAHFLYSLSAYALTSSNIDRFSNLFHCLNQKNICNNAITKDPTTPQMCRYTTFWNLKATIGKKDDLYNI